MILHEANIPMKISKGAVSTAISLVMGSLAIALAACGGDGADATSSSSSGAGGAAASSSSTSMSQASGTGSGGEGTGSGGGSGGGGGAPSGMVPGIIAVGYGGIRVVSRDLGVTWGDRAFEVADGGDDEHLLRAVVYGNGLWIATGWKYWTSPNGVDWTSHGLISEGILPCNIVEGLAYLGGSYWAACNIYLSGQPDPVSAVFRSTDGLTWGKEAFGTISSDAKGHLSLAAHGEKMVAYGDDGVSFESKDGVTWSVMAGLVAATYCEGQWKSLEACDPTAVSKANGNEYYDGVSFFDGAWLKGAWKGKIVRATDGKSYETVYTDDQMNSLYRGRAFADGYVAPAK